MNKPRVHFVTPGQSLSIIAGMYGTTVAAILKLNPGIENPQRIFPDQRIAIPEGKVEPGWLVIARGELGVAGIPGPDHNARVLEYHATTALKATADEVPWCSSFANFCLEKSGRKGTGSAAARSWLTWGRPLETPVPGAIAVFRRGKDPAAGHVAFFIIEENGRIEVLGGNQAGRVCIVRFPARDLIGYRWPAA